MVAASSLMLRVFRTAPIMGTPKCASSVGGMLPARTATVSPLPTPRRATAALRQRPQHGLTIRWRAFQLNPGMAAEGMDRKTYLDLKFGGRERAARVYEAVTMAGRGEAIAFAFDRIKRTPNTLDSHRLLRFADTERQHDLAEALFIGYFT